MAFELALPPNLDRVHNVFLVSLLKKYVRDESHIILNYIKLDIQSNAMHEEKPLKILHQRDKILGTKIVPLVKVLLSSRVVEEASWEKEEDIRIEYSKLFEK